MDTLLASREMDKELFYSSSLPVARISLTNGLSFWISAVSNIMGSKSTAKKIPPWFWLAKVLPHFYPSGVLTVR